MSFDTDIFGKVLLGGQPPEQPKPAEPAPVGMREKLNRATELALDHNIEVLAMPLDTEDKAMLKAKTATANHVLTTPVRVEETKFKAQRSEDTLNRLLEIIAEEKKKLGRI
jgi:hypothetical protein